MGKGELTWFRCCRRRRWWLASVISSLFLLFVYSSGSCFLYFLLRLCVCCFFPSSLPGFLLCSSSLCLCFSTLFFQLPLVFMVFYVLLSVLYFFFVFLSSVGSLSLPVFFVPSLFVSLFLSSPVLLPCLCCSQSSPFKTKTMVVKAWGFAAGWGTKIFPGSVSLRRFCSFSPVFSLVSFFPSPVVSPVFPPFSPIPPCPLFLHAFVPHHREARTPLFLWAETGAKNLPPSV